MEIRLNVFIVETECSVCGRAHYIPLNTDGFWSGVAPCDDETQMEVQVDPEMFEEVKRVYLKISKCSRTRH
jgi:hypothetical protein